MPHLLARPMLLSARVRHRMSFHRATVPRETVAQLTVQKIVPEPKSNVRQGEQAGAPVIQEQLGKDVQ